MFCLFQFTEHQRFYTLPRTFNQSQFPHGVSPGEIGNTLQPETIMAENYFNSLSLREQLEQSAVERRA